MPAETTSQVRLWPMYAGGFLGPFGGAMVVPMLPELRDGLDTSLTVVASGLTVYLIPFALLMIVSGTLAERWGRRRTVRLAYAVYAVASLVCAVAPGAASFLAGRVVQGAANAFTTPILLAAITDLVGDRQLGRALGRFGSLQAAGLAFAPLIGGAAAAVDWRWGFVSIVLASVGLAAVPPPDAPPRPAPDGSRWHSLRNHRLALACGLAALMYLTAIGVTTLSALIAEDRFGLGPGERGLLVAVFGGAGLAGGGLVGRQLDRLGLRRFGTVGMALLAAATALAGVAPGVALLVAALALAGVAGIVCRVTVNAMAVRSTPDNRSGAASMMLAWQFLGGALAPVLLLPIYHRDPAWSLIAGAASCLLAAAILAASPARLLPAG